MAELGNLHVDETHRRQGIGTWLVGLAADWLELGGVARLLDYVTVDEPGYEACVAFLGRVGFRELTRTVRGWHGRAAGGSPRRPLTRSS